MLDATGHCPNLSAPDATGGRDSRIRRREDATTEDALTTGGSYEAFADALLDDDPETLYEQAPCGYVTTDPDGSDRQGKSNVPGP